MSTNHENRSELTKKVKGLLSKVLDIEEDEMQLDTLLFKELAIESAETLEITFRLEQEFSISIGEAEFWNIANLIANEDMIVDGNFTEEAKPLLKRIYLLLIVKLKNFIVLLKYMIIFLLRI